MSSILFFLKRNPKLIVAAIAVIILIANVSYVFWLRRKVIKQEEQIVVLKTDTLNKANEIIQLKGDTSFYIRQIDRIIEKSNKLGELDRERNKGLSQEFPDIGTLKNKRK